MKLVELAIRNTRLTLSVLVFLILSGTMLPLEDAPGWMKVLVNINPLGYVVDAERALFAGDFASSSVLAGIVAAVGVAVVGLGVGVRAVK